jgi:hypothetical protein
VKSIALKSTAVKSTAPTASESKRAGQVPAQILALPTMTLPQLWVLWDKFYARRPARPNRVHIEARLTYKLQEEAFGALPVDTRDMLANYGARFSKIKTPASKLRVVLPGTKLLREFDGRQYSVTVQSDGYYEFDGKSYKSLSAIAKRITGTQWSGPAFFGLKGKTA